MADRVPHSGHADQIQRLLDGSPVSLPHQYGIAPLPGNLDRFVVANRRINDPIEVGTGGSSCDGLHAGTVRYPVRFARGIFAPNVRGDASARWTLVQLRGFSPAHPPDSVDWLSCRAACVISLLLKERAEIDAETPRRKHLKMAALLLLISFCSCKCASPRRHGFPADGFATCRGAMGLLP